LLGILCGKCGARSTARWGKGLAAQQRQRLGIKPAWSPSAATLCRVLWHVDVEEVAAVIEAWVGGVHEQLVAAGLTQGIAIDGKSIRRAASLGARDVHLLGAVCHQLRVVLAQLPVSDKTNEITTVAPLLERLLLKGLVITVDALLTQRHIARHIRQGGGHYIMLVKENQPKMRWALQRLFDAPRHSTVPPPQTAKTIDKGHGRLEVRTIAASTALNDYLSWPGLAQVFQLTRRVTHLKTGKHTVKTVYGITSLSPAQATPQQLLAHIRHHWEAIENGVHWVRDVVMGEDASKAHKATAPQAMATLRNLAINIARLRGFDSITAALDAFSANPSRTISLHYVCTFGSEMKAGEPI
jgi:predicted transposase YbfD/YdcC